MIVEYELVPNEQGFLTCPKWIPDGGYIPDRVADTLVGFLLAADFPEVHPGWVRTLTRYQAGTHAEDTSRVYPWYYPDGTKMTLAQVRVAAYEIIDANNPDV